MWRKLICLCDLCYETGCSFFKPKYDFFLNLTKYFDYVVICELFVSMLYIESVTGSYLLQIIAILTTELFIFPSWHWRDG